MSDRFQFLELDDGAPSARSRLAARGSRLGTASVPSPGSDVDERSEVLPGSHCEPRAASRERAEGAPNWRVVEVIGGPGTQFGQFQSPGGIAVDGLGNLFVADSYNHRVQRITPEGDVATIGERGDRPGAFLNPQGIASAGDLGFFVVEQGSHRVQAFSPQGDYLGGWGGPGSGPDRLRAPMGIACGPKGDLFVADTGNSRLLRLSARQLQLAEGRRSAGIEIRHPLFRRPQGVCVDAGGTLFVADTFAHCVFRFDGGGRLTGVLTPASGWRAEPTAGAGAFEEPQDLAVDEQGRLYVAECGGHRLRIFDAEGRLLQTVTDAGKLGPFAAPAAVAVTLDGSVYLADTGNHRILRLENR